jgi:hypothetical protein
MGCCQYVCKQIIAVKIVNNKKKRNFMVAKKIIGDRQKIYFFLFFHRCKGKIVQKNKRTRRKTFKMFFLNRKIEVQKVYAS